MKLRRGLCYYRTIRAGWETTAFRPKLRSVIQWRGAPPRRRLAAAGLLTLGAGAPVVAHHAFAAEFDGAKPVTLKGTVIKMEWVNPHAWLHMEVQGPDGKAVAWAVEGGAPNALLRRGWNKNSVPPGTQLTVEGFRAKDGSNRANGREATLPNGQKLFIGSSGTGAPADGRDQSEKK